MHRFALSALCALLAAGCVGRPVPVEPRPAPQSVEEKDERDAFVAAEIEVAEAEVEADIVVAEVDAVLGFALDPNGFDLPIVVNERVVYWIHYFNTRHRDWFATYLRRMGRYEEHILGRLSERGLPRDLIYLALIESGFTPRAYSRAHAVGIWQFIPGTGRRFGLEQNAWLDERRDPLKSTEAALAYLEQLYDQFGSWYLAAAAYNSGENRIERLLRQHADGERGDDELYWLISPRLPAETRNYVPKILAAAIIAKHRVHFGFDEVEPEAPERYDIAWVPDATDLAVIAELADADDAEVRLLNPQFVQGVTPPRRRVAVRLPAGSADAFAERYAQLPPERRVRFLHHTVARGETLSGIARQYGTTVATLQDANGIRNPHALRAGTRLIIPRGAAGTARTVAAAARPPGSATAGPSRQATAPPAASPGATGAQAPASAAPRLASDGTHRVASGESLWSLARAYGVSVEDLRRWNGIQGDRIVAGRTLIVRGDQVVVHEVQPGDTLWSIARRHGVTLRQLMEWNDLGEDVVLRPGDRVEVRLAR